MPETPTVEREIDLPVPTDEAWALLTEPGSLEEWLAPAVDLVPEPGTPLRVREADGSERVGIVERAVAGEELRFRWWPVDEPGRESQVSLVVVGIPTGSRLVVTESLVAGPVALGAWAGRLRACAALAVAARVG